MVRSVPCSCYRRSPRVHRFPTSRRETHPDDGDTLQESSHGGGSHHPFHTYARPLFPKMPPRWLCLLRHARIDCANQTWSSEAAAGFPSPSSPSQETSAGSGNHLKNAVFDTSGGACGRLLPELGRDAFGSKIVILETTRAPVPRPLTASVPRPRSPAWTSRTPRVEEQVPFPSPALLGRSVRMNGRSRAGGLVMRDRRLAYRWDSARQSWQARRETVLAGCVRAVMNEASTDNRV